MKHDTQNGMNCVNANVDQMQVFAIITICWNEDKCKCECKELIDKGVCKKGFIWNPSNCGCECGKSCDIGKYLDYEKCKCRKNNS